VKPSSKPGEVNRPWQKANQRCSIQVIACSGEDINGSGEIKFSATILPAGG
jgi:hypothetical protein